jgi:ABC-2 type transport system permease protein
MTEAQGELYDIGYQRYLGPREGRNRARKAVWSSGVRTVLGLGRGARAKVLPALLFFSAMAPAVVITLVVSVAGPDSGVPGHAGYYQIISVFILLFSAIMAPELLCPDRRDRVIDLYMVRPLTPGDYVGARWLAFLVVTLSIVYAGQIILLVGLILAAPDPLEYIRENWLIVPRFLLAGLVIAAFTTTLPMAVSAFTTRRAYAAAFVIGLYLISAPVGGILTECQEHGNDEEAGVRIELGGGGQSEGGQGAGQEASRAAANGEEVECKRLAGDAAKWYALVDLGQVPAHVNDLIFEEKNDSEAVQLASDLPYAIPVAWYLFLTLGSGAVLWWRYSRLAR